MTYIKKYLFLFIFSLLFVSCEKDPLTAHDCKTEIKGLLCRTFLFENDRGIGYIDYNYTDTVLTGLIYTNNKGKVRRKVYFTYNTQGQLVKEVVMNTDGGIESKSYAYTSFNKTEQIVSFKDNELIGKMLFYYDEQENLIKKEVYDINSLDSINIYEYDSDGALWRLSFYDSNGALLKYHIHTPFSNGVKRINTYNPKGVFLSYELFLFDENDLLYEHTVYNHELELVEKNIYEYANKSLVKASQYNGLLQLLSYRILFYS